MYYNYTRLALGYVFERWFYSRLSCNVLRDHLVHWRYPHIYMCLSNFTPLLNWVTLFQLMPVRAWGPRYWCPPCIITRVRDPVQHYGLVVVLSFWCSWELPDGVWTHNLWATTDVLNLLGYSANIFDTIDGFINKLRMLLSYQSNSTESSTWEYTVFQKIAVIGINSTT